MSICFNAINAFICLAPPKNEELISEGKLDDFEVCIVRESTTCRVAITEECMEEEIIGLV